MHKCSVRILTEVMLSEVETEFSVRMTIKGNYILLNIIRETFALSRINLNREAHDLAITSHRADKRTMKEIKMKLLAPHNDISQNELECLYSGQNSICDDVKLRQLIERDSLHARKNVVVKDNAGYGTPIAIGLSNKENNHTIRLAVEAVQQNIPCNKIDCMHEYKYVDLPNKRMNKSVEGRCVGTQPVNCFIKRLYGITLTWDNIIKETSSQLVFEAVKPAIEGSDIYFYVKKGNGGFRSPYTMRRISINDKSSKLLQPILNELASKHPVAEQKDYYLVNIFTEESWLFNEVEDNKITLDIIKNNLVQYFRNKEHTMPKKQKNQIIYSGSTDTALKEILYIYSIQGNDIFFPYKCEATERNPFQPAEMPTRRTLNVGTPKIHELSAVFVLDQTLLCNLEEQSNLLSPSIQKRRTAVIHNRKRSVSRRQSVQCEDSINAVLFNKDITRSKLERLFEEKQTGWK
ncbi:16425_t:CDS:2 [Cetraspora pellucida]|uniref:16425_t:CDS:1 n=1 Tax=Cetraspora pellucida TaxID=1433469 RepID=A0A9N9DFJ7_9GLOM|nr:16425_t:CDS:2 [Cetraspora pellucida]